MKRLTAFIVILLLLSVSQLSIYAEDEIPEEFEELIDELPSEVQDALPDGISDSDLDSFAEAIKRLTSWDFIWDNLFSMAFVEWDQILYALCSIVSVLVLSSLINALSESMKNDAISHILQLISGMILVLTIIKLSFDPLQKSEALLNSLRMFTNTLSPLICGMYAMGGNVTSALVHNYGLIVFLSIFENVCIVALDMILGVCISLTLASAFVPEGNLASISSAVKKTFTFFVGFLMLVFSTVISTQSLLASKADTLSSKTAKMLAAQMIPMVGGTIGESLRMAGASVEYLRSTVGIALIIILVVVIMPTIITIFLYRTVFIASNAVAGLLGCSREGSILTEMASIFGYVLATLSITAVALLFLITVFAKCASPLS